MAMSDVVQAEGSLAGIEEKLGEIAGFVSELPAMKITMELLADRLAIIEDDMRAPSGPSPLQEAIEKLTEAVLMQAGHIERLARMGDAPAAHAEWREWLDDLKVKFGGLVDDPADPASAVDWAWVSENLPPPDERADG
jgi:hypothetical protein